MTVLKLAGIGILARMTYEDLTCRKIHVLWFVALFLIIGAQGITAVSTKEWVVTSIRNTIIGTILILSAWLGSALIRGLKPPKLGDVIGSGDIILIIVIAFAFTTASYMAFLIIALGFSLIAHLIVQRTLKLQEPNVALAGWIALDLAVLWMGQLGGIPIFDRIQAY